MDNKEIIENNKLIAEFMGVDVNYSDIVYKDSKSPLRHFIDNRNKLDGLDFHNSWDWLMPVVEKCKETLETIETEFESEERAKFEEEIFSLDETLEDFFTNNLEAIYRRCIEFIKWYNEQNIQEK